MATLRLRAVLAFGLLLCAPSLVWANGFRIPDQGAKAMGMANAAAAQGTDATALYTNPAAVGELDGTYTASGFTFIYAMGAEFTSDGRDPAGFNGPLPDETSDDQLFVPAHMFLVTDGGTERWNFGLAIFTPFGLGRDWDNPRGFARNVDDVDLQTGEIQLSVTYEIMDNMYFAVMGRYMLARLNLEASPQIFLGPAPLGTHTIDVSADGDGFGYGAAFYWEPCDAVNVGLLYRSEITAELDGHAEANRILTFLQPAVGGRSSFETEVNTEIHFPSNLALGIAFKPTDELLIEVDVDFTMWESFQGLSAHLDAQLPPLMTNEILSLKAGWHNTFTYRLGGQYTINDQWKARLGYVYDQNPVPDHTLHPSLPDSDRHGATFGVGYTSGDYTIDFAYMALFFEDRDVNNGITSPQNPLHDGTYENMAHLWALTIGKKW